jgi:hypothetical protein
MPRGVRSDTEYPLLFFCFFVGMINNRLAGTMRAVELLSTLNKLRGQYLLVYFGILWVH